MNPLLKQFSLIRSIAPTQIVERLKAYAKKQKPSELPPASKALIKKIEKYREDLEKFGIPPFLEIAEVNEYMQTGVFLKPDSKPIKAGEFIGLYTGDYELVFESETEGNHYAYDVAPGIKLKADDLPLVRGMGKKATIKESYSIQTSASNHGNFTRYINHSSIDTNIEAMTRKMPDGTIEVCLFAAKTIKPSEQLLSNYGGQYWAVLPIIPEPVKARSYRLENNGQIVKEKNQIPSRHPSTLTLLRSLRADLELDTDHLTRTFRTFLSKQKIRCAPSALQTKIESFEDEILERALPLTLDIEPGSSILHWDIMVAKDIKKIKKGSFIGLIGGKFQLLPDPHKHDIHSGIVFNKKHLCLRQDEAYNFTKLITFSEHGNLKATLYKKRGCSTLYIVLTALRDLKPLDRLHIKNCFINGY